MRESGQLDIVFVASPANAQSPHMPYFYLYLSGYLEKQGFAVEIANPHYKADEANVAFILKLISQKQPRYVGLSCFCTDYDAVHRLAVEIRKVTSAKILVGNAQPSIAPEDFLYEGSPFDIVVRGEGELTVKEILLNKELSVESLSEIHGLAYFDGQKVVQTQNRQLMNLADLGRPAYHLIDMNWYLRPTKNLIRRIATVCAVIYTGRGCPFDCNFCASNVVWNTNDRAPGNSMVRSRPLSEVIAELFLLQNEYGFDFFYILDDTFGLKESAVADFCHAYKSSGLKMLWAAETRANCVKSPELVKLLKEAGCIQLDFGVESGSPAMLDAVKKKIKLEHIHRAFDLCESHGMRTFANLLLNLPGETENDIDLSHALLKRIRPTYTSIGLTQPYPGTPIYRTLGRRIDKKDYHLLDREFPPEEFRLCSHQLNLKKLLYEWQMKYKTFTPFETSMIKADVRYWWKIFASKHRLGYLIFLLKEFSIQPIRYLRAKYNRPSRWAAEGD